MKISVLTPTHNRVDLLPKLYQSLKENNRQEIEIEWLIMDDGSTDSTQNKIEELKKENIIEIHYFYQENQGKMVAINQLVEKAKGEFIIECDDDDYFTTNAFQTIQKTCKKYREKKDIYGFCFLKYDQEGKNMGNLFSQKETTMFDLYFREGETGEKAIVFFSEIRKQYKHQLEKHEKFITEARMYHEMDLKRHLITINEPIMICEYQKEGYTKNYSKQCKENPFGYYQYFKEILERDMKKVLFSKRLYAIKHYILFTELTKTKKALQNIKGFQNKMWYILLYIPGILKSKVKFRRN